MPIADIIIEVLLKSLVIMASLIGSIILAGVMLGVLKNIISRYIQYTLGFGGIMLTAWLGTPIHELGHAAMCVVFGHTIRDMKLFHVSDNEGNVTLGYVSHSYNKNNIYHKIGNFFIGIGPIISGTVVILTSMWLLLPKQFKQISANIKIYSWNELTTFSFVYNLRDTAFKVFSILFVGDNMRSVVFWVFMVIAICVSSHMALSVSDMKGAASGLSAIYFICLIINIISPVFSAVSGKFLHAIVVYNSYLIFALLIAIFCSICSAMLSLALYGIRIVLTS